MPLPDLIEVLAHLDFAVCVPINTSLKGNETEHHINKVLGEVAGTLGDRYTVQEIRSRLWRAFSQKQFYAEYNFVQLFLHGSSELTLEPSIRKLVKDQLNLIFLHEPKAGKAGRQLRRGRVSSLAPAGAETPRSGRSRTRASKQATNGIDQKDRTVAARGRTSKNKALQAKYHASSVSTCETIQPSPELCMEFKPDSFQPMEEYATTSNDVIICEPPRSYAQNPAEKTPPRTEQLETNLRSRKNVRSDKSVAQENEMTTSSASELVRYKRLYYEGVEKCLDLEESHEETVLLLSTELAHYKKLFHEEVEERARMDWQGREILRWRGTHAKSAEIIQDKDSQIRKLQKKLHKQSALECHFDVDNLRHPLSNDRSLRLNFFDLKYKVSKMYVSEESEDTSRLDMDGLFGESKDLDHLLSTIYPVCDASFPRKTSSVPSRPSLGELVPTLTGAAIHLWIYGSEFRWPAMTITPLLQKYREHLATVCGDENLWQLDAFVHRSMVEEKVFIEEVIPVMASTFTTRLLKALRPLLKEEVRHGTLHAEILSIAKLAIHIRSMSLVGTEKCVSIWPSANTSLDDCTMEDENTERARATGRVRLPICPGIQVYPKQAGVIDYQGFGHADESEVPCKDTLKALVVCG